MNAFRTLLQSAVILVLLVAPGCMYHEARTTDPLALHRSVWTVDSHTDTPMRFTDESFDVSRAHPTGKRGSGKVDFPRMKAGGLDAIFFAVFTGQGPLTDDGREAAYRKAQRITDAIHRVVENHPDMAELALTPEDGYRIEKTGKRAVFIGMENGYPLGTSLDRVKEFYDRGVRYITLCHSSNNDICDSSTDDAPLHGGLSPFGKQVVAEMNRLGMMIDVSHLADSSVRDVLATSKAPVFASHSCARALCDHPRNLPDDLIQAIANRGGVIQVTMVPSFVKQFPPDPDRDAAFTAFRKKYAHYDTLPDAEREKVRAEWRKLADQYPRPEPTVAEFVDHIDHIVRIAGIDHVGIGSDSDGGGSLKDCRDVSEFPKITAELVRRGYGPDAIRKIWGGNFLRFFREVVRVSREHADPR